MHTINTEFTSRIAVYIKKKKLTQANKTLSTLCQDSTLKSDLIGQWTAMQKSLLHAGESIHCVHHVIFQHPFKSALHSQITKKSNKYKRTFMQITLRLIYNKHISRTSTWHGHYT